MGYSVTRTSLCGAASAFAISVLLATPAAAQFVGDEIVVYTQKREQSVLEVPLAVTAYDSEDLEQLGVQQFDDLADFVPGLEVQEQSPNNPGFVIRGITSDSGAANIEPRVAIYQDGVSIARSRGSFVELFDASVEVAKGPQATLFGRSALIGAINIIQNKPDLTALSAEIRGGIGNYGHDLVDGYVNVPVVEDVLGVRISGRRKQRDGYVENALGGADFQGYQLGAARGAVRWRPIPDFTVDVIGNYQVDDNPGTSFKSGTFATPGGDTSPFTAAALSTANDFLGGEELGVEREIWGVTLLTDWGVNDALTVQTTSAYRQFDSLEVFDPDGFALPALVFAEEADSEQWSTEVRAIFDNGGPVTGFAGFSYFHEDGSQVVPLQVDERVAQILLAPPGSLPAPLNQLLAPPNFAPLAAFPAINLTAAGLGAIIPLQPYQLEQFSNYGETDAFDFYADVTWRPLERLELTAGARYTFEDRFSGLSSRLLNGPSSLSPVPGGGLVIGGALTNGQIVGVSDDFDGFTWRAVAKYDVTDFWNVYFNYGRGRRPEVIEGVGVIGTAAVDGVGPEDFEVLPAEIVNSYELGSKARLFADTLSLDGAVFFYDYSNFQTGVVTSAGVFETVNAGAAHTIGLEFAAGWRPTDIAEFFATYSYNRSRFNDEDDAGNPQAFAGNRFRLNPDHSFSVGSTISDAASWGRVWFTPTYTWRSKVFFDDTNDQNVNPRNGLSLEPIDFLQDEFQESYGVVDMRIGYETPDGRVGVEFFVDNLLDRRFIIDAGNTGDGFGIPTFIAGPPRLLGGYVTLRY